MQAASPYSAKHQQSTKDTEPSECKKIYQSSENKGKYSTSSQRRVDCLSNKLDFDKLMASVGEQSEHKVEQLQNGTYNLYKSARLIPDTESNKLYIKLYDNNRKLSSKNLDKDNPRKNITGGKLDLGP